MVEMIRAAGDHSVTMIRDLAIAIIREGRVPTDWKENFIVFSLREKAMLLIGATAVV